MLLQHNNAMVKAMAKAWPCLKTLSLAKNYTPMHPSHVTLGGLILFAEFCLNLSTLCIVFHTQDIEKAEVGTIQGVKNMALKALRVLTSPISLLGKVAAFLLDVFPNLVCITNSDKEGGEEEEEEDEEDEDMTNQDRKWLVVNNLLPTFVSVREKVYVLNR